MDVNGIIITVFSILTMQLIINIFYVFTIFNMFKMIIAKDDRMTKCKNQNCTKTKLEE